MLYNETYILFLIYYYEAYILLIYNEDIISSSGYKTSDSCIVYIVLFSVFLIINIFMGTSVYFFFLFKK